MRLILLPFGLLCALMLTGAARAQTLPAPISPPAQTASVPVSEAAPAPADDTLAVPAPPGSTVQVDIDVRDDDLLGVFKSLLRGIGDDGQAAVNSTPAPPAPARPGHAMAMEAQVATILSHADLGDILKDVTHVRFVVYQMSGAVPPMTHLLPKGKSLLAAPAPPVMADQTPQYEAAYAAEGGHRIVFINAEPIHVLMMSFGHARGSALVVQGPGTLAVLRENGYPDLSKLSALATQIGTVAAQSASQGKSGSGKP